MAVGVTVVDAVTRMGGTCTWRELRRCVPWRAIGPAVTAGEVVRNGQGIYSVPSAEQSVVIGRRLTGVVSHRSAALLWGWKVKTVPTLPDVTIPRNRKLRVSARDLATVHWRNLPASDVESGTTTRARTVVDCCLDLPLDEALAVFDSALRHGLAMMSVVETARVLSLRQRRRVVRAARLADRRAANPFESVLRAIALSVEGLSVVPQHKIRDGGLFARVDLADTDLRVVLEADSFEFHGERAALGRDCRRYDELTVRDWLVLRFSWEQVMFEPDWVAAMLTAVVALRRCQGYGAGEMTGSTAVAAVG